jgi:hypothetical protein
MVTRLPHGLQKLLEVTVGMPWPEGNENDLWELAGAWQVFAGELAVLGDGLLAEADGFARVIQGATGGSIRTALATDLHDGANQLKEQAEAYSKMLENAGADIQKTKIMVIGMLAILAATIAALLTSLFGSFAVPSVIAAARVGIGVALRSLLARLMEAGLVGIARELAMKSFIGAVIGAGFMVGLDAGVQGVQIAQGHRIGLDTASLKGSAIGGALGGAFGGAAEGVVAVAARAGRVLWRVLPRSVRAVGPLAGPLVPIPAAALSNPAINAATHSPGGAMDGIFGALDAGGGHAHPQVPGGSVRPLASWHPRDLPGINPVTGIRPVTANSTPVGTAFTASVAEAGGAGGTRPAGHQGSGSSRPATAGGHDESVASGRGGEGAAVAELPTWALPTSGGRAGETAGAGRDSGTGGAAAVGGVGAGRDPGPVSAAAAGGTVTGPRATVGAGRNPGTAAAAAASGETAGAGPDSGAVSAAAVGSTVTGRRATAAGTGSATAAGGAAGASGQGTGTTAGRPVETTGQPRAAGRAAGGQAQSTPTRPLGEHQLTSPPTAAGARAAAQGPVGITSPRAGSAAAPPAETTLSRFLGDAGATVLPDTAAKPTPQPGLDHQHRPQAFEPGDTRAEPLPRDGGSADDAGPAVLRRTEEPGTEQIHPPAGGVPSTSDARQAGVPVERSASRPQDTGGPDRTSTYSAGSRPERDLAGRDENPAGERQAGRSFRSGVDDGTPPRTSSRGQLFPAEAGAPAHDSHPAAETSLRMSEPDSAGDRAREESPADPAPGRIRLAGRSGGQRIKFFADEVGFAPLERDGQVVGLTFTSGHGRDRVRDWAAVPGSGQRTASVPAGYDSYEAARRAGVVTEQRAPWPDNAFFVNAHAVPERIAVTLEGGAEVAVSGGGLAYIAAQIPMFRDVIRTRKPEAFVLLTCSTGATAGGAAQTFQRALAESFGYDRPVVAPSGSLDLITGGDRAGTAVVMHGGAWRTFTTGSAPLLGRDHENRTRFLRTAEIGGPRPLLDGDRLIGITYRDEPQSPGTLDRNGSTFFIAADGDRHSFGVTHTGGHRVILDGATFARLAGAADLFRRGVPGTDSVTLLADFTGAGGAAADFQRALATATGVHRPVFAPVGVVTGDVRWQRFAADTPRPSPSARGIDLVGTADGGPRRFSPIDVAATPLERDGRVVGVTFAVGELREFARRWAAQPADRNLTALAPSGTHDYLSGGAVTVRRAPWPDNAFFVAGHADAAGFAVELTDGTRVSVRGDVLAGLAGQLPVFRHAVREQRPEAFVLIACATGAGEVAPRFQRTLAERFGGDFDRPVVAPSGGVQAVLSPDVTTMVADGGTWRTFATGPAPVLGVDEANRAGYVRAAQVASRPLFDGRRLTGLTFAADGEAGHPASRGSGRFFVAAEGRPDAFGVRTTDGRRLFVDGDVFARLVVESAPFRRYTEERGTTPVVLVADSAGAVNRPGGAGWDFRNALGAAEVFAPTGAVAADRWRVLKPEALRPDGTGPPRGLAEARSFPLDAPPPGWLDNARREAADAAERMRVPAAEAAERMHERAAGAAERLYRKPRHEPPLAEPESRPEPAAPAVFGPAGPAERLHRARIDRPKVAGDIDAAGLRGAIAGLLGRKAAGGSSLRKLVDQAFSDENLKKDFDRTLDGGVVVDLGAGGRGTQVAIEAVAVSSPREASTTTGSVSREHVAGPVRQRLHTVRAAVNTEPRAIRVPLPFVMIAGKLAGLINLRGSELRSTTNRETKTKVSESDVESTTAKHDVTYRITVRKPGRYRWSKPVVQVGYHDVETGLTWPEHPATAHPAKAPPVRPDVVEHTELSGLGQVYRAVVAGRAAAAVTDPETRRFRDWLDRLPARGRELFSGEPVRESFGFGGKAPVEVVVGIAAKDGEQLPDVRGSVTATRKFSAEHLVSQSYTRRWGGSVTLGVGDFTHTFGGYAGFVGSTYRTTKTGTGRIDEHGHELSTVYKGPIGKQRIELDYVVRAGDAPAVTVAGTATVWTRPAEPGRPTEPAGTPPSDDPLGAGRFAVPDRVDARFRLPEPVVADIAGRVLHRLDATGLVKGKDLARVNERFRTFLAEHAKQVVQGGDGVRFPLSAWHKGAPDVFVRGLLQPEAASYLGVVDAESLDGKVSLGHTHTVEIAKGVDRSRGVVGNLYRSKPTATAVNLQITRENNQRDTGKSEQHVGAEKSLTTAGPVHRFAYPAQFEVRAGGRWSEPGEVLHWRDSSGETDGYPVAKIEGRVEVTAAGRAGDDLEPEAPREETGGWQGTGGRRPELRAGALPPGFELESLKPIPGLLGTATAMMNVPAGTSWRSWVRKAVAGPPPPDVDRHRGRRTFEREAGEPDERNVALDELENFAAPTARIAQFERVALFQDTVRLKSHNTPGLLGSRELVARIDLSARLGNPRLLARDEAHSFRHVAKTRTNREAKAETGAGYKARLSLFEVGPIGTALAEGAELSIGGSHVHTDGVIRIDGTAATDRGDRVERGYLVGFDATYDVRTSARRDWGDVTGLWHEGAAREESRWIRLPDAVKVWVPAGEVHRVGELTAADVAKLGPAEAGLYRTEQAKLAEPARKTAEPAESDGDVRAPGNVGRGTGTVELYRLEAGAELVRQVQVRVEAWADEHRGPGPDPVDLARATLLEPAGARPRSPFDPINDRLVHDVLGPMLTGAAADAAVREMLTGGRSVFLEGNTAFGKVEQLVVLRAVLGEGSYHRTLTESAGTADLEATRTAGAVDSHRWGLDFGLSSVNSISPHDRPGSMLTAGLNFMRRLTSTAESTHERKEVVTAEHSGAAVQFVHDLRVSVEVHPYARPGHYSKHLPGWFPTPGPRAVDAPWRSEFELPGAVRSTVPEEDTVPLGAEPAGPVEQVTGSLREWQRRAGRPPGFAPAAVLQVRPFAATTLHAALNELVSGAGGRPALRPRAGYQLRSATESGPLRANVRELLSPGGYVIPVASDVVAHVRITADLVHRELVRVLDGAPLKPEVNDKHTVKLIRDLKGEAGLSWSVDLRAVNAGTERGRPALMISDSTTPLVPWADYDTTSVSTKRTEPARDLDGEQRYLVRVTPIWELQAAYRAGKAAAGPIRTAPDEPILIELDRPGLESLGLHDPGLPTPHPASPMIRRGSSDDLLTSLADFGFRRTRSRLRSEDSWPGWAFSRSFVSSARGLEPAPVRAPDPAHPGPGGLAGRTDNGETRSFGAADVQVHPLTRRGQTIGMTFLTGAERRHDVRWAEGLGPVTTPFFISTHGEPETLAVHLADGTRLRVPGGVFARVVAVAKPFRDAVTADPRQAITLLVCHAGAQAGEGGVAHDFQRTLEAEFGHRQPDVAATHVVDLMADPGRGAPGRRASATAVRAGGHWRTFAGPGTGVRSLGSDLYGVAKTGEVRRFAASEVRVQPLTRGGRTIGLTFLQGDSRRFDAKWAKSVVPGKQFTHFFAPDTATFYDRSWGHGVRRGTAPWPADAFSISAHGEPGSFTVTLTDGTTLQVPGEGFARVVAAAAPFRNTMGADDRRAIVLLVCRAGADAHPGGAAHDFQRTIEGEFGFRQPVVAATRAVELAYDLSAPLKHSAAKRFKGLFTGGLRKYPAVTGVRDGGRWRVFSAGAAGLLGIDSTDSARYFTSAEVRSAALTDGERTVGVSFQAEVAAERPNYGAEVPWPRSSFLVDAPSVGSEFRLRLLDGSRVRVDGAGLAEVVRESAAFRTADRPWSMVLLARTSPAQALGKPSDGPGDFRAALAGTFAGPVFAPKAALPAPGDASNATGWQRVPRPAPVRENRPSGAPAGPGVRGTVPAEPVSLKEFLSTGGPRTG